MNVGRTDINNLLSQMREMKAATMPAGQAGVELQGTQGVQQALNGRIEQADSSSPSFSTMFKSAVDGVNQSQKTASSLKVAYEQGVPGVSLSQVMIASQKSSVAFDAMTQVRNKVVEAYKDVMNMPV
ncbi:flagellar hook-basal body complex protein FliE [Dasania sp. GY-MA-18]|uniref:Flagellar hook-basal body complex protein FliE n=1 Tax=Dasania phycosphaerae TaxID=2950436 RepID=A0A9J6RIB5_9GAMM|nr:MULTISPECIES: flagellar hook-basal body complex protein FliE [Dasania]MCR8921653.1 flagellar hook-basal body complex protein FliE [Dasania sp. GY-MA-18]MCZ0864081.1 flagellar hook-basal body complex protein FliE [Dasania phycosphaerae]MCZ0867809.1 flagellar hook-basal body complex protein FliE [Dasania phycosphaerae]